MGKYDFVMGLDSGRGLGNPRSREEEAEAKMRQEADAMRARVDAAGQGGEYENAPMVGDEDSPEQHQNLMGVGRKLAGEFRAPPVAPAGGDWRGVESIGRAAEDTRRRAESYGRGAPPREGIQGIQDTALDLLARAQSRSRR